jgi:transglutaminase-like putative cysteine protease
MSPRKVHAARRHRKNRRVLLVFTVLLVVMLLAVVYFVYPKNPAGSEQTQPEATTLVSPSEAPTAFEAFRNNYLTIMQDLNSSQTKTAMTALLASNSNQTDIFPWEHSKLTFTRDPAGWSDDPIQILEHGTGICEQFSVVYVSACLALGYQSRLVVAVDTSSWTFIHVWAEDFYKGTWVHVDPSDSVWDNPSVYQSWDWGSAIGSGVRIYAFEDGRFEDVTSSYSAHSN